MAEELIPSYYPGKVIRRETVEAEKQAIYPDIENRFTYHAPKGDQPKRYENLRGNAKSLAILIFESCPDSRERSLALTKLEEAVMWANAAIARNE
jgi:hypothetical protein